MKVVIPRYVVDVPRRYTQIQMLIVWVWGLNFVHLKRRNTQGGFLPYNIRKQRDPIQENQLQFYIFERVGDRHE
jgi:hypothetical protein